MTQYQNHVSGNQQGFASIVIGLVLVMVMALLTVGFAQLTSREQQDALDKQLANQAYYAAETGINDTYQALQVRIQHNTLGDWTDDNGSTCMTDSDITTNESINHAANVSYTCVMVNPAPPQLQYTDVGDGAAKTSVFTTTTNVQSLTIKWTPTGNVPPATGTSFLPESGGDPNWNAPAVLQFSLTPMGAGPTYNDATLASKSFTAFLYPSTSGNTSAPYDPGFSGNGPIISNTCSTDPTGNVTSCIAKITGITGSGPYLVHVLNLYQETAEIDVQAFGGSIVPLSLNGAQATIDVTGKAQDVLKRLEVAVPLNPVPDVPDYAVQAENICKRFETYPGATNFINPDGGTAASGDACDLE